MQTVVRVLPRGQITIPNKIRKSLKLSENSLLEIQETKDGLFLRPVVVGQFKNVDFRKIRGSWARYQDEIGEALEKISKLPKNKKPLLFR